MLIFYLISFALALSPGCRKLKYRSRMVCRRCHENPKLRELYITKMAEIKRELAKCYETNVEKRQESKPNGVKRRHKVYKWSQNLISRYWIKVDYMILVNYFNDYIKPLLSLTKSQWLQVWSEVFWFMIGFHGRFIEQEQYRNKTQPRATKSTISVLFSNLLIRWKWGLFL